MSMVTLSVPGALYSDGSIPEKDREAARVNVEFTLDEAKIVHDILVSYEYSRPIAYGVPATMEEIDLCLDLAASIALAIV